ncbi:hypothetical protein GCM10027605_11450 [Micromonospora zhanjiangensis]
MAGTVALLGLAALAAGHSSLEFSRVAADGLDELDLPGSPQPSPSFPTELPSAGPAAAPPPPDDGGLPQWLGTAAAVLVAVLGVVVVVLVLRRVTRDVLRRRTRALTPVDRAGPGTTEEVVAALDAGLVELSDTDTDPRTAVIACWVRLEQAAASAGVPRRVGDTPTDLVTRLLRGAGGPDDAADPDATVRTAGAPASAGPVVVSADVLAAFAHVYREARYATHTVDQAMRDEARAALRRLRAELTGVSA